MKYQIPLKGESKLKIKYFVLLILCIILLTGCNTVDANKNVEDVRVQYLDEFQQLKNERDKISSDNKKLEDKLAQLNSELEQCKNESVSQISQLESDILEKDMLIDKYEYENNLFDTYDTVPNKFLLALMDKDYEKMNDVLGDPLEIREEDGSIYVYENNEFKAFLGKSNYEASGYTIHGFNYLESEELFIIYGQIFYEADGEYVTPPTYIDMGFKVNKDNIPSLTIDWVSRDV